MQVGSRLALSTKIDEPPARVHAHITRALQAELDQLTFSTRQFAFFNLLRQLRERLAHSTSAIYLACLGELGFDCLRVIRPRLVSPTQVYEINSQVVRIRLRQDGQDGAVDYPKAELFIAVYDEHMSAALFP